jgi:lysophospholipase L1-like esterase
MNRRLSLAIASTTGAVLLGALIPWTALSTPPSLTPAAAVASITEGAARPSPTPTAFTAITVMAVGDSITYGASGATGDAYRPELSRLMNRAGQPHTWTVAAMPGTTCHHWALYLDAAITTHHPQLMFLDCGTNDDPTRDSTEADYRAILDVAAARGVQVVAAYIGRPDMASATNTVRPWIEGWMDQTNQAIGRALAAHPEVVAADMRRVPANIEWLQADGIHLTDRSYRAYGQIFYQAAAPARGWKTMGQLGLVEMCGLHGTAPGQPWPTPNVAYRVCTS